MSAAPVRKQPQPIRHDVEDDENIYITRMPSSVRRYKTTRDVLPETDETMAPRGKLIQRRSSSQNQQNLHGIASNAVSPSRPDNRQEAFFSSQHALHLKQNRQRQFPLVSVLVGMVVMVVLIMSLSAFSSWWQVYQDDLHYGRPRTSQLDAVVGHNDSSAHPTHFIFINMNRHIEIMEIPGGDMSHMRVFNGPILYGSGQELTSVTGEIRIENGRRDLILHIMNQQMVFINDGTTFHPQ